MKEFAEKFYKSKAWQNCRNAYAASRQGLCERCLTKGIITAGEIVHHIIELTPDNINNPNVTLNWDNLELLCRNCHGEAHGKKKKRFKIDEAGRVILPQSIKKFFAWETGWWGSIFLSPVFFPPY